MRLFTEPVPSEILQPLRFLQNDKYTVFRIATQPIRLALLKKLSLQVYSTGVYLEILFREKELEGSGGGLGGPLIPHAETKKTIKKKRAVLIINLFI